MECLQRVEMFLDRVYHIEYRQMMNEEKEERKIERENESRA
jgi:hypothetical protein